MKAFNINLNRPFTQSLVTIIGIYLVFFALSSYMYQLITGITPQGIIELLFMPFQAIEQGGGALLSLSVILVAALLITITILIWQGRLARFIGIHLSYFFIAILIACSVTVMIYGYLFEDMSGFLPYPQYILYMYSLSQTQANGSDFAFALLLGFGGVTFAYGAYLVKTFWHYGQPLGKAHFAHGLDIYRAGLFANKGFVLGKSAYGKLRFKDFEPIIVVSGTGGGKSSAIVMPNMFELRDENIVVTDIKGEIYAKTANFRAAIGQAVYRFEPGNPDTHRYNPLGLVRKSHIDEDLDVIFKTLIPDSHDPIWADASRNIAKMIAMYYILEKNKTPTLQGIYEEICKRNFAEEVELLCETIETPRVANLFGKFISARDKTRRDLLLNAQEYMAKFDSPNLAQATSGNDFDFRDLRTKPMTIYLIMPGNTATYNSICAIFFEQMIRLCTEQHTPDHDEFAINAIIDEFANLPKMPSIAKGISFLRSYRIRVCAFIQQISQLKDVYGENKKESFMASPLKVAFNVTSLNDAQYFSNLAGKKTITVKNQSMNEGMSMNVSTQKQYKDVISPDEVAQLKQSSLLIYRTGFNVIKASKNFWFKSRSYKQSSS